MQLAEGRGIPQGGVARLKARHNKENTMSLQALKDGLPDYARDLKLNLGAVAGEPGLTEQQKAGTFIASAIASRNATVIEAVIAEFGPKVEPAVIAAAKAAAAIMGMNNIYYRFVHLVEKEEYRALPARLRMNVIANPGVPKQDFELWSLAVSAVNGCGLCVTAHEKVLRDSGLSAEQVQAAVRLAAVVHAVAVTLEAEAVPAPEALAA
jgi:alkyl hydroperoxide reductase subunit D